MPVATHMKTPVVPASISVLLEMFTMETKRTKDEYESHRHNDFDK